MVYDVPWVPIIHTGVDTPLNSYMGTWVRLIHHCSSNRIRESHPYWPHSTTNINHHGWQNTKALSSSDLDGVWCIMSSNHPYPYRYWYHCQFMNECMCEVDTPLHKQPGKRIKYILNVQHTNDGTSWINEYWHMFSLYLVWCVMYHELQSLLHVLTPLSSHS